MDMPPEYDDRRRELRELVVTLARVPHSRRTFIGTALAVPAAAWLVGCSGSDNAEDTPTVASGRDGSPAAGVSVERWSDVRGLFDLDPDVQHLSAYVLAPHSRPVREAIEAHRAGLDANPWPYLLETEPLIEEVGRAAARHLGARVGQIALTESTTMGLGLLIGGMRFAPGEEVLITEHEHFVASEAARHAAERTGASVRKVALYPPAEPEQATTAGILSALRDAIGGQTRLVVVTWVHSATGVKLPLREIADVIAAANAGRAPEQRALLVVDGVHGFGAEPIDVDSVGCDGFVSGAHKWLIGPRGTGVAWARPELWERVTPIIPTFDRRLFDAWIDGEQGVAPPGPTATPGGYHAFEHRWALREAFQLHDRVGAKRIARRVTELSDQLRDGLAGAEGIRVRTPAEPRLHSGVVTFSVAGMEPSEAVDRIWDADRVSATVTPYATQFARLGTSWINTEDEVDAAIRSVRAL
jgi:selenocysteine lyase/cysteine desulfurase